MKFVGTQSNFLKGLVRTVPIAGKNSQLPVLEHVLLQLKDGLMHITATDLEVGVHTTVPGKVEVEGACTLLARPFMEYVQQLPTEQPLQLEVKKGSAFLSTKGYEAHFPTASDDDFPLLPKLTSDKRVEMDGKLFCQALGRTLFSAARDETRPEIHSVYVYTTEDTFVVAATDSFRLAENKYEVEGVKAGMSFLLPLPAAQEIVRLFGEASKISIGVQESHLQVSSEGIELSSRLIDGKYPDYQQIIPNSFSIEGETDKQQLLRALKTLLVFLPRDSRRVRLVVKPSKDKIILSAGGGQSGEGVVEVPFEGEGDELDVLFNITYLIEGLGYIEDPKVKLKFVGENGPAAVVGHKETQGYLYVVMPIQAQ